MTSQVTHRVVSRSAMQQILDVTRKLATPFDLTTMLGEVVDAGRSVLEADAGTVWLYESDTDELATHVATGLKSMRLPASRGIVGECARTRKIVNVTDCYADPRFNPDIDKSSGYRTRCLLAVPLIGHDDALVGVLQMVNKHDGVFDRDDEMVAESLAAQCAVALQRVQMIEALLVKERLTREIAVAREIQSATFPRAMPQLSGYDIAGISRPADETGGDTFDFVPVAEDRLFVLLGDASGHGLGPALSATQVRAMLRVALRIGAGLDGVFTHINNQLADDLPDDRFVTAFMGMLNTTAHTIDYHAGGQGPLAHFHADSGTIDWHAPTTFPMGFLPQAGVDAPHRLAMQPGDILALISDGVYEFENTGGEQFGEVRVGNVIQHHCALGANQIVEGLLESLSEFSGGASQSDDITIIIVRRRAGAEG
jgi:phosphoserine phosphatase